MATESLIVELDAKTRKLDAKMRSLDKRFDNLDSSVKQVDKSLSGFSKVAIGVASALSVSALLNYTDTLQLAENQLRSVTASTEEFNLIQTELNRIAQDTRQSVSELTSVYARFKRAGEEAGFSQKETLDLTESLTKAFKIEGNSVAEVNSVLLQLTQSFRSGRIAGEEFRALSEGSTLVLRALSAQLGVTTGDLKELAADGLVTPADLIEGLKGANDEIQEAFKSLEPTFAEVGTSWGNAAAAAYNDSFLENIVGNIKTDLIEASAKMQRFFAGEEVLTETELVEKIEQVTDKIKILREWISEGKGGIFTDSRLEGAVEDLEELNTRLTELRANQDSSQLDDIMITEGIEDPRIQQERDFIDAVAEIQLEKAMTDEERFTQDLLIHKAALDTKLINEKEYLKAVDASKKQFAKIKSEETKIDKRANTQKLNQQQAMIRGAMALNTLLFDDNKAIAGGLIIADTATAIMKSLSINPYDYVNPIVIAATGAAQLANALSSSKGGGSVSAPSGGGASQTPQQARQDELETSSLELSSQDENSANVLTIKFDVDSGDDLTDAIAGALNNKMRRE